MVKVCDFDTILRIYKSKHKKQSLETSPLNTSTNGILKAT